MEYLEKIQKIMKLFKILAKIAFVACIVGASLCLVALVFLLLADTLGFIEEAEAVRMVGKMDETFTTAYCAVAMGMVNCLTALFVTRKWLEYFKMEEKDGTPFSLESGKFLGKVAIFSFIMSLVAIVLSGIIAAVSELLGGSLEIANVKYTVDISTVIFSLLLSNVFMYGATVKKEN